MIKVLSFLPNKNCFAGHMWPAGHGLSTTDLSETIKWHWKNSNVL